MAHAHKSRIKRQADAMRKLTKAAKKDGQPNVMRWLIDRLDERAECRKQQADSGKNPD